MSSKIRAEKNASPVLELTLRSLAQEAYDHIKKLILSGVLKEGDKIPEEGIANSLNVSRTPIREALRRLERYGLVVIKPRSHAKVTGVTGREAEHIAHVRVELERLAARYLLQRAGPEDIKALRRLAQETLDSVREGDRPRALLLDSAFHLEMVRRSGNDILYDILERLDPKAQLVRVRFASKFSTELLVEVLQVHLDIVDALEVGDEERLLRSVGGNIKPEQGGPSLFAPLAEQAPRGVAKETI